MNFSLFREPSGEPSVRALPFPRLQSLNRARRPDGIGRGLAAGLVLAGIFLGFYTFLTDIRPISGWLFSKLSVIWGYELFLSIACASFGLRFVEQVCGLRALPFLEKLAFALPCGLVAFVVGMYLGGFLGWYGPRFATLMPLTLLLSGLVGRRMRVVMWLRAARHQTPPSALSVIAAGFGTFGIGLVYLGLLTPDAVNYDAGWNHLVIAQDYARAGRITPLIGDWVKNVPHLGSIVNTWAFLVPGLNEAPLRWMQALHNEFTTFLWSLIAVGAAVRFLAERQGVRSGWAALFLFPSILVYDGNMGAAADHYLALFSVPVLLAGLRFLDALTWRRGLLLGWLAGGALLTKLHAVYLLIPLTMLASVRIAELAFARARAGDPSDTRLRHALVAALVGALMASALLALHFGKNAVFYKNPFYPMAQGTFPSEPTLPDAQLQMDYLFGDWHWHPPHELSDRLLAGLKLMYSFSFHPHYVFVSSEPTFGSLFTLLIPMIFFIGRARRLSLAIIVTLGAVFTWSMTFWVDRSLQTFMPALAAVTGALIARTWELGILARLPLIALVGLQVVWAGDYYFSGTDRIAGSIALIRSGFDGRSEDRFGQYRRDYRDLGASLPKNALVMLHNNHIMLGIDRPVLLDWAGYQAVFDYRNYKSPRDLHDRLLKLGVTHVVFLPGARTAPTKQEEVIFGAYAKMNANTTTNFGGLRVFPVAKAPAKLARPLSVLAWHLGDYGTGVYPVEALLSNDEMPPHMQQHPDARVVFTATSDPLKLLEEVDAFLAPSSAVFPPPLRDALNHQFTAARVHGSLSLYLRKIPGLNSLE
ncbi:MAG: hypothetical protein RL701_6458 [Pseudomonadota bacterium]